MRLLWILLGFTALALGLIGIVLPLVPTTPFVILAAFFFAKGSPRLARYLEEHRIFGPMIADWRTNGAIAPRYKAVAMAMMLGVLGLSLWMALDWRLIAVQAVCIAGAAAFILTRPNG